MILKDTKISDIFNVNFEHVVAWQQASKIMIGLIRWSKEEEPQKKKLFFPHEIILQS